MQTQWHIGFTMVWLAGLLLVYVYYEKAKKHEDEWHACISEESRQYHWHRSKHLMLSGHLLFSTLMAPFSQWFLVATILLGFYITFWLTKFPVPKTAT